MSLTGSEAFLDQVAEDQALEARMLALIEGKNVEVAAEEVAQMARGLGFEVDAEDVVDECWAVLQGAEDGNPVDEDGISLEELRG